MAVDIRIPLLDKGMIKSKDENFAVDDHEMVRLELEKLLDLQDDVEVVGRGGKRVSKYLALELHPDVIVMDIVMPEDEWD